MLLEISDKIRWLIFESGRTTYKIAKDLGFSVQSLDRYKNDPKKIDGMSLWRAEKINRYINRFATEEEIIKALNKPKKVKEIIDVYGEKQLIDESTRKMVNYKNAEQKIRYSARIVEDGKLIDFWTDYFEDGTVDELEPKLRVWNNAVLAGYSEYVGYNSIDNDPDDKIWNDLVKHVKEHESEYFDENGDWLPNRLIEINFK